MDAAILDGKDMRVCNENAVLLVQPDDLGETFLGREADHGKCGRTHRQAADAEIGRHELQMHHQLVAELPAHALDMRQQVDGREQALQIGRGLVAFEHLQGRVIPGKLIERHAARIVLGGGEIAFVAECGVMFRRERVRSRKPRRCDDRDHQRTPRRHVTQRREIRGEASIGRSHEFFLDARLRGECEPEASGLRERRETPGEFHPRDRRLHRNGDLGRERRGAVGVVDRVGLRTQELHGRGRVAHRHHARRQHIAAIAQPAPGDRADAARTAGDEAADRRRPFRRRIHPDLPALRAQGTVECEHVHARFDARHAMPDGEQPVEPRHVDDRATPQRHRLSVIAGAAGARGERNPMPARQHRHLQKLGLVPRLHHDVTRAVLQLSLQHGTVPEEIAAFPPQHGGIGGCRDVTEACGKSVEIHGGAHPPSIASLARMRARS